ncbi:N-formylglutamate amidohydrolase [Mameliella sp.]|uniref:N-formylglutamate amidohydrolase n=1 Tax=Mameliella sp. TaxID=1924940 RepID=UPI003BA8F8DB
MIEHPVVLNPEGRFPGLIVVDHAGTDLPERFGNLGLDPHWQRTHHFCDLWIDDVARRLAEVLDAPVILGTVSRLVIDLNRWLEDPRSIPMQIEGIPVTGNIAMSEAERQARHDAIFWPYHRRLTDLWTGIADRHPDPVFLALHSCTRVFDGQHRPWDCGTIWNDSPRFSNALLRQLGRDSDLNLGDNQPYSGRNGVYTIDRHTHGTGHLACGLEISNDLLESSADRSAWSGRLGSALTALVSEGMAP